MNICYKLILNQRIERIVPTIVLISLPVVIIFTAGFEQFTPFTIVRVLLAFLITLTFLIYLIKKLNKKRLTTFSLLLSLIITSTIILSIGGSWVINIMLDYLTYPIRVFEQIRGFRIIWLVFIIYFAISLNFILKEKKFKLSLTLILPYLFILTIQYLYFWKTYHSPITARQDSFYTLCQWVEKNTKKDSLFAVLVNPNTILTDNMRLKSCAKRSMVISFDAINLAYTSDQALILAKDRLEDMISGVQKNDSAFIKQKYFPDYIVKTKESLRNDEYDQIKYANNLYAVLSFKK